MPIRLCYIVRCLALLVCSPAALLPAHAQRCVAQGDGTTWGPCGGGGRSITIIVEQPPIIIQGPPQIVWVRPDVKGSAQGSFATVTDTSVRMGLDDISITGWQQFIKARKAEQQGNLELAKDYCDAARARRNSAEEDREINIRCDLIGRALFDRRENTSARLQFGKFEKSPNAERFALEIDFTPKQQELMEALFDPKRREYEHLRQKILPLYIARAKAESTVSQLDLERKNPAKHSNRNIEKKLEDARGAALKADLEVKAKLKEIEPLIVIRK